MAVVVEAHQLQAPSRVRYIKLGAEGASAPDCFAAGQLALGFPDIPHALCQAGDWEGVRARFIAAGKTAPKASDHTRELRDFYTLGADALWITFADGRLWWAFAAPEVTWNEALPRLPRVRRTLAPWRSTDLADRPLLLREFSTRLTSVRGYRSTICEVKAGDYLLRKINAQSEPLIEEAETVLTAVRDVAVRLIGELHEKDFELLVDLIFAASGWRRVSVLGETEKDIDLLVEQIATGERAFVQVKSTATPAVLDDYIERFRAYAGADRMVFACHSPSPALAKRCAEARDHVDLWFADTLARKAVRAGLFDWLIERVR